MAHIKCFPTLVSWTGNYPRFTTKMLNNTGRRFKVFELWSYEYLCMHNGNSNVIQRLGFEIYRISKTIRNIQYHFRVLDSWFEVAKQSCGWGLIWVMIIDSLLTSISTSSMDLNRNSTDYLGFWIRWNPYNPLVRPQSSNLSPSSSPCWSSGNQSRRLFEKKIEGFDCKINGPALGAALTSTLRPAVPVPGTLAQRWLAGRASTNTGHFRVGSSSCGLPLLLNWLSLRVKKV